MLAPVCGFGEQGFSLWRSLGDSISLRWRRTLQSLYCSIFGDNILWRVLGGLQHPCFHSRCSSLLSRENSEEASHLMEFHLGSDRAPPDTGRCPFAIG